MPAKRLTQKIRRLLPPVLTVVFVAVPVTLSALWLAFHHKPGWYQPANLDEAGAQRARSQAVGVADFVSDRMVEGEEFDVLLHDRSINEWLAAWLRDWPDGRDALPPELSDPAIHFDAGRIRVAAYFATGGWRAIVSVALTLGLTVDGSAVEIRLSGAQGGSLPVPRVILEDVLDHLLQGARAGGDAGRDSPSTTGLLASIMREVRSVDELFEGVRIRNRFVWFNGERPFRIESLTIDDGNLRLRVRPL